MKGKFRIAVFYVIIVALVLTSVTVAQYPGYVWGTAYQLVNIDTTDANVVVDYYKADGTKESAATRTYSAIPPLGSVLVVQKKDDPALNGMYSAVVSSDKQMAAIVNQQTYLPGGTSPYPPFSSYSSMSSGSKNFFLPAIMYNYYSFYTEVFIMNVGSGVATVRIDYYPSTVFGVVTGQTGVSDLNLSIPANASLMVSQQSKSALGKVACGANSCFFGGAKVTSDQDIVVVVNQHNPVQKKLMTYNGFPSGSLTLTFPNYMRKYYEYYSALTVSNTDSANNACVRITYIPDATQSKKVDGTPVVPATDTVVADHVISPLNSLLMFDGFTATDDQSDLDDAINYSQFFGTVKVESIVGTVGATTCGVAANIAGIINIESLRDRNSQGGSYNGVDPATGTSTLIAPIILADYYGYYTNLTVQNVTANSGTCSFSYTSGPDSAVPNQSRSYDHAILPNGQITVYEGRKGTPRGDINTDTFWQSASGNRFIGAAKVTCTNGVKLVGFTNEEKDILQIDSMYTFNTINR